MATNKETMVVIAEGVGFHDPTEAEKLTGEIAVRIAFDASDNFMAATEGMKLKAVQAIVKDLEEAEPESMIAILKALFLASNMEAAAKELDLLDICNTYDEYSYILIDNYVCSFGTDNMEQRDYLDSLNKKLLMAMEKRHSIRSSYKDILDAMYETDPEELQDIKPSNFYNYIEKLFG